MQKIYNSAKNVTFLDRFFERLYDVPYGAMVDGTWGYAGHQHDFNVPDEGLMRIALDKVPTGGLCNLDIEPSFDHLDQPELNLHLADWRNPDHDVPVNVRLKFLTLAKKIRPDVKFSLYGVPHTVPKGFDTRANTFLHDREIAARRLITEQDFLCISAYGNGLSWAKWQRRVDAKYGAAKLYHNDKPLMFMVGHETEYGVDDWQTWGRRLDYLASLRNDGIIYWAMQKTVDIPWWVGLKLWDIRQR